MLNKSLFSPDRPHRAGIGWVTPAALSILLAYSLSVQTCPLLYIKLCDTGLVFPKPASASPTIGEDQSAPRPGVTQSIKYFHPSCPCLLFRRLLAPLPPALPRSSVSSKHGRTMKRTHSHDQGL